MADSRWWTKFADTSQNSFFAWCRPSDPEPDYIGDEENDDYEENYDDKPYSGPPPVMHSKSGTITVKAGETALLPCNVENGENFVLMWLNATTPQATAGMWTNNMRQMAKDDRVNKLENNAIQIENVNIYDAGIYICKLLTAPELNVTHTLLVEAQVPPGTKPSITMFKPSKEVNVRKGDDLVLNCEARGNPAPKITWSKNDNKNNEAKMQEDGTTLMINSVTRKNSGIYTCNAHNNFGTDTKSVTVHVHYAPEIEMEEDSITTADSEISVNLICTVHATPRPKVTWLKDNKVLTQTQHMLNEKNKYTLHLPNIKSSDFGQYTCEASNKEGRSNATRVLSGKPKKPTLETTKDAGDGKKPQMMWRVESYSPITEYELLHKTRQEQEWKTVKVVLGDQQKNIYIYNIKHTFDNSLPSAEYETKMRAKNKYGWSDISDTHFFTKDEQGELSESSLLGSISTNHTTVANTKEITISTVFNNASLGQQLFDILSSKNVNEEALNELAKTQNISTKIDKKGVDDLVNAFKSISKAYKEDEMVKNKLETVFMNWLNKLNIEKSLETLSGMTNSSTTVNNLLNRTSESADSSASELRISAVFLTSLFVARLYC